MVGLSTIETSFWVQLAHMQLVVVGAGFAGLALADRLNQQGVKVTVVEASPQPGGLAAGFRQPEWDWSLEHHYHHIFVSDYDIQQVADKVGTEVVFYQPETSIWYHDQIYAFDTPLALLQYPELDWISKLRTAAALAFLRFWPAGDKLRPILAADWLAATMGDKAYQQLWQPLLAAKFGQHYRQVSLSWFWARIKVRSRRLGYFVGGFQQLADDWVAYLRQKGVEFRFGTQVTGLSSQGQVWQVELSNKQNISADKVVVAAPSSVLRRLVDLPKSYWQAYDRQPRLGAVSLIIQLNQSLLPGTYWLNINQPAKFLAVVEHTNMVEKQHYDDQHLVYVGNYLPADHSYFRLSAQQLLDEYWPDLRKINPKLRKSWVKRVWKFAAPFAQPVVTSSYLESLPDSQTPLSGLYWLSMEHVYPYDRGTNYAVAWGTKLADKIIAQL